MNILFYLDNESETPITSFYDLASNPFKVGDVVSLEVNELYPAEYLKFNNEKKQIELISRNTDLQNTFNNKKIMIVKEGKYMRFNKLNEPILTIEYHCKFFG